MIVSLRLVLLWLVWMRFLICLKGWKILFSLFVGILMLVFFILKSNSFLDVFVLIWIVIWLFGVNLIVLFIRLIKIWCRWVVLIVIFFGILLLVIMVRIRFFLLVCIIIKLYRLVKKLVRCSGVGLSFSLFVIMWDILSRLFSRFNRCLLLFKMVDSFGWMCLLWWLFNSSFV